MYKKTSYMRRRYADRRACHGQSMVETAIVAPLLILLLLGTAWVGILAGDYVTVGNATRQGARVAAELGNQQHPGPCGFQTHQDHLDQVAVDTDIVQNVDAVLTPGLNAATPKWMVIYPATLNNTKHDSSGKSTGQWIQDDTLSPPEVGDAWKYDARTRKWTQITGPYDFNFFLCERSQTPTAETPIGVEVVWDYHSVTSFLPAGIPTIEQWTVMRAVPTHP